jgi:metal-dependent amidase/aminoacylase/carboxypeptidase family protein
MIKLTAGLTLFFCNISTFAQDVSKTIDAKSLAVQSKVVEWRRHLHQNPELGNREFKTAAYIAER